MPKVARSISQTSISGSKNAIALICRDTQHLRLQKVEHDDAHVRVAATAESSHPAEPLFVPELLSRHSLHDVEQLLDHEVFQGAERLPLEDGPD